MTKVSLELDDIKALASDSRLAIMSALDGKKLNLRDLTRITELNKATLHTHLQKLLDAGFIKKNTRKGHKWVYYRLTWKGECLLHPENTKIVVLFSLAFFSLCAGIIQFYTYAKGTIVGMAQTLPHTEITRIYALTEDHGTMSANQRILSNVAEIPTRNQTIEQLSQALNENATIQGLAKNEFTNYDFRWSQTSEYFNDIISETGSQIQSGQEHLVADRASNVFAYVNDPTFLYLGLFLLAVAVILICFASWRLWVTRTQKF